MWWADTDEGAQIGDSLGFFAIPRSSPALFVSGAAITFNVDRPETRQLARWFTQGQFGSAYSTFEGGVPANQAVLTSTFLQRTERGSQQASLVSSAIGTDSIRIFPVGQATVPIEVLEALADATEEWLAGGPDVLESALAKVEAAWQAWESQQG